MSGLIRGMPGHVRLALQLAVTLALLALLWRAAGGPEAARSLASADLGWLALALGTLTVQTILSALRWQLTARQFGIRIGLGTAIHEYYLSQVVNQSLPGGVVGDAGRAMRSRSQAGLMPAGQAVIFERLAGQVAMFAMLGLAFAATWTVPGGLDWPRPLAGPLALLLAASLCLPFLVTMLRRLPGPIGRSTERITTGFRMSLGTGRVLTAQVALSIGTVLCNIAAFGFCLWAVGAQIGIPALCALVPLILTTMLIPVSISGWGLREGAAAALLPIAGVAASDALAGSVAFGLTYLASVLPGALLPALNSRPAGGETGDRPGQSTHGGPAPACRLESPQGPPSLDETTGRT